LQDPQRDPRMPVVEAAADPLPVHADDLDDAPGAGLLRGLLHDLLEHPGMGGAPGIAEADGGVRLVHAAIIAACAGAALVFGEFGAIVRPCTCPSTHRRPTRPPTAVPMRRGSGARSTPAWPSSWRCWRCSRPSSTSTGGYWPSHPARWKACG